MKYGERLYIARKRAKLSQVKLAELTNNTVGQGTISKIERGDQEYSAYDIELADILNIHPKWLRDEDPRYTPDWLKDNCVKNETNGYSAENLKIPSRHVANNSKELQALMLMREMADFQQDEWLNEGKQKVELYKKFQTKT